MSTDTYWLIALVLGKLCYFPLNYRPSKYYFEFPPIDTKIPLIPIWIVPYYLYFSYLLAGGIFIWQTSFRHEYLIAYTLATFSASLFWYFIPNGVKRPDASHLKPSWPAKAIQQLYRHDKDGNGFPSAHVYASLITSWYLIQAFPQYWYLWFGIGTAIALSTIFTKQHYIVDLVGGIAWTIGAVWFSSILGW